jgi:hypothetical protein
VKIVYMGAHSILEYDEVRLFHELGHEVFSIGAYIHPSRPLDDHRPPLPQVPEVPECIAAVDALGQQGHADTLMATKDMGLPDVILDWAEVIICSALEHRWVVPNWDRLRHKRVVWRTIGQSGDRNEAMMAPLRRDGLQIVRYSPKERNIPGYAGADALIRFYKDPDEYGPWVGDQKVVTNISQNLYRRSLADDGKLQPPGWQWTSFGFWDAATTGLRRVPAGPGSEAHGGLGALPYDKMRLWLTNARAYLATGTQPASYVLNFVEAMMSGMPTVSIGPSWYRILPYGSELLEMHELAPIATEDAEVAYDYLKRILHDDAYAQRVSEASRFLALEHFAMDKVAEQWDDFLAGRTVAPKLEAVAA